MRQVIRTPDAPSSALWSQAIKVGPAVYLSGITGIDPKTDALAGETVGEQTRQALANCASILKAAAASLADVAEVQVLLLRPGDFAAMNEEYSKVFAVDPPARTVAKLGVELPNVLVSIRMTAVL